MYSFREILESKNFLNNIWKYVFSKWPLSELELSSQNQDMYRISRFKGKYAITLAPFIHCQMNNQNFFKCISWEMKKRSLEGQIWVPYVKFESNYNNWTTTDAPSLSSTYFKYQVSYRKVISEVHKIVINPERKPPGEHERRYNTPVIDEVVWQ